MKEFASMKREIRIALITLMTTLAIARPIPTEIEDSNALNQHSRKPPPEIAEAITNSTGDLYSDVKLISNTSIFKAQCSGLDLTTRAAKLQVCQIVQEGPDMLVALSLQTCIVGSFSLDTQANLL